MIVKNNQGLFQTIVQSTLPLLAACTCSFPDSVPRKARPSGTQERNLGDSVGTVMRHATSPTGRLQLLNMTG